MPTRSSLVTALLDNVDIALRQVAADENRPSRDMLIQTYVLPLLQLEIYKWADIHKKQGANSCRQPRLRQNAGPNVFLIHTEERSTSTADCSAGTWCWC